MARERPGASGSLPPDAPAAGRGGRRRRRARVGAREVNARWVRERRIERCRASATLHTELGSWPLRARRRAGRRARARGAQGPPARRRCRGPDRGRARRPLRGRGARAARAGVGGRRARRWRSGRRRRARSRCCCARSASPMARGEDGVWRVSGDASWRDAEYAFEVTVFAPAVDRVVTNVVTDPVLAGADASTRTGRCSRELHAARALAEAAARAARATRRSTSCTSATSRSATRACPKPTAAPTSRSRTPTAPGCATCARWPRPGMTHRAPAAVPTTSRRSRRTAPRHRRSRPAARPRARLASEQQRRVGEVRDRDGFNWGYDPLHYTTPEGSYAVDPANRTEEFRAMVRGAQRDRPARRARRRLQPHARRRPAPALDPGPDRPGLLPPALAARARSRPRPAARTPRPSAG